MCNTCAHILFTNIPTLNDGGGTITTIRPDHKHYIRGAISRPQMDLRGNGGNGLPLEVGFF